MRAPTKSAYLKFGRLAAGAAAACSLLAARASLAVSTGLEETAGQAGYKTSTAPSIAVVVGSLINPILGLVGVLFLLLMIWGGFTWMTASGNEEKIGKAKQLITGAVIGMIIIFASYAITSFVVSNVITATQSGT